jgi:RND family efflux transporter MFP subunit
MKLLRISLGVLVWTAALDSQAGDKKKPEPKLVVVPVANPVARTVTDHAEFIGHAEAQNLVTVKPRVTGYLEKVAFKEGGEVKKDDVLFQIDPRPYEARLALAKAKLVLAEASLKAARSANQRLKAIAAKAVGAVSVQELDQAQAQEDQAAAVLDVERAELSAKKIDLDYTVIRAPISGRIDRAQLSVGNLVVQDKTKLTTIVTLEPMYVYFDVDESTFLRILKNRGADKGNIKAPIDMRLSGETGYPHAGAVDFVSSRVDVKTASVQARGVFKNPTAGDGAPLLMPGMSVLVRVPISKPFEALLVIDRALVTDQGAKFLYVLERDNKVAMRRVTIGQLQPDGLRVVTEGLKKDDAVVIGAISKLRPGTTVEPERVAMPKLLEQPK